MNALLDVLVSAFTGPDDYEAPPWFEPACRSASFIALSADDEGYLKNDAGMVVDRVHGTPVLYRNKIPAGWALIVMAPEKS